MKPLRAYLFCRTLDGTWSVEVFRDWESLEKELKVGAEFVRSCLFLHVGFWRPDTTEIHNLADSWPDRLLISSAAINALPIEIVVSAKPVHHVGKLPVHLCLGGWGYEIADPTLNNQSQPNPTPPEPLPTPEVSPTTASLIANHRKNSGTNWVQWTAVQRHDLAIVFEQASITNDEEFLVKEKDIQWPEVRLELALIRFRMLTGEKPDPKDFIDKIYATPYWFLDQPLTGFNLTVRQTNVFSGHELLTVQDIGAKGSNGLLKLPNMGRKSLNDLATLLVESFKEGIGLCMPASARLAPPDQISVPPVENSSAGFNVRPEDIVTSSFESFSDGINAAVKHIKLEDRGVWAARIGYKCQRLTLQQIADTVGLTRERVRQLEAKVFRHVAKSDFWQQLSERIAQVLKDRESPLLVGGLSAIDPWFDSDIDFEHPLKEICKALLENRYSVFKVRDVAVLTELTRNGWEDAVGNAKSALEAIIGTGVTETEAKSIIFGLLPDKGRELRNDLWNEVTLDAKWSGTDQDNRILIGFGNDIETVILTILNGSEVPLHTSEITRRVRSYGIANHDEHYVRNAAQKMALLFNRGTYGLPKHIPLTDEQMSIIRVEAESIISEGEPTRQWHTSELFDLLEERGLDFDGKLTKYLINIALKESPVLSYLRRMVWGLSEHWSNKSTERLDVRQAVIALLESEGHPMSIAEIRERLTQERGVGTHFQIHPVTPLIRIGPSMFGLDYRDIDYEKVHPLIDKLRDALVMKKAGLHISEVPDAIGLQGTDAETLAATVVMVSLRHGLKQDKAQYVFLEEWQSSRRYSASAAFLQAIKETAGKSVSSNQIWKRMCELTQRTISQNAVSHMLRDENYKWDEGTGLWSADLDQDDEE